MPPCAILHMLFQEPRTPPRPCSDPSPLPRRQGPHLGHQASGQGLRQALGRAQPAPAPTAPGPRHCQAVIQGHGQQREKGHKSSSGGPRGRLNRLIVHYNKPSMFQARLTSYRHGGLFKYVPPPSLPVTQNGPALHRATWLSLCGLTWTRGTPLCTLPQWPSPFTGQPGFPLKVDLG